MSKLHRISPFQLKLNMKKFIPGLVLGCSGPRDISQSHQAQMTSLLEQKGQLTRPGKENDHIVFVLCIIQAFRFPLPLTTCTKTWVERALFDFIKMQCKNKGRSDRNCMQRFLSNQPNQSPNIAMLNIKPIGQIQPEEPFQPAHHQSSRLRKLGGCDEWSTACSRIRDPWTLMDMAITGRG